MKPELEDTMAAASVAAPPAAAGALDRTATLAAPVTSASASADPAAAPGGLAPGQQLGHFRIDRALGAGGMGEVYLATDLALDRPVAIKVLPEALAREPRLRERLIREARAQARVVHPNVGHIYYIGEEAGRLYFAMEYVPGETLAQRVARGPLAPDDALAAIRAAALGLREAQRSGFLHRDVKPSNLMYDAHGVVKVLDFGLAASGGDGRDGRDASGTGGTGGGPAGAAGVVAQTSLAGTPLYMAPEQARGEAVDLRTDIYALGVTLYHLVAGAPPFVADTVGELVSLHASASRPRLARGPGRRRAARAPRTQLEAIDALCARMMAPRPEDRFASYDELLRAIDLASSAYTRPAGFWVRSMAAGVDLLVFTVVVTLGLELAGVQRDLTGALLGVFALCQALAVARWGRTPGKALFELEVVDTATLARPRLGRALLRAAFIYGPASVSAVVAEAFDVAGWQTATAVALAALGASFAIPGALLAYASLRVPGKRTAWDRGAGAMVRYRTGRSAGAL